MKALLYAAAAVIPLTLAAAPTPFVASAAAEVAVTPAETELLDAVGGKAALQKTAFLRIDADGEGFTISESHLPESGGVTSNSFKKTTWIDLKGDRLRIEHDRNVSFNFWEQRPNPRHVYTEIVDGKRGYVAGLDNILAIGPRPMFADRVAGTRKHQRLLHPHLVFADVARGLRSVSVGGEQTVEGARYRTYAVSDPVAPLVYWVDTATGRIDKLTTLESRPDQRDAPLEVRYDRWRKVGALLVPEETKILLSNELIQHEVRATRIEARAPAEAFAIPADALAQFRAIAGTPQGQIIQSWYGTPAANFERALDDPQAARFGEASSQFLNTFTEMGVAFNAYHNLVLPAEIAPGVHLLLGSSNNSMLVEQDDSLVLIEAPLSPERSKAIIDFAAKTYPSKRIKTIVVTHYHYDHVAGLRQFIHDGATVVASDVSASYLATLGDRSSTLAPDDQSRAPKQAKTDPIAYGAVKTLASRKNEVRLIHAANRHAADWTYVFLPEPGVLFTGDVHNPPFPPLSQSEFTDFIADFEKRGFDVKVSAGGHGATQTGDEFRALITSVRAASPQPAPDGGL